MWIAAGTLFLAPTIFFISIGSMYAEPVTLKTLFPGYKGVMPPLKEFPYEHQFRNFEIFGNTSLIGYNTMSLVRRDHIIFGYIWGSSDLISDLCDLFNILEDVSIAFDINSERWITLSGDLSRKLGSDRRIFLVVARDEVAATHVTTSKNPLYKEAHIRACTEANNRVDVVEKEQEERLLYRASTREESIRVIKEEYSQAYNRAFMLRLHPHGENDIHGYRKRHP